MKRTLAILALLACSALVAAQTTRPALQIEVRHNGKSLQIIVPPEVAERVANGAQTDEDRAAVAVATELALGHLGEPRNNPCHRPLTSGPNLIDAGRLPTNCHDSVQPK